MFSIEWVLALIRPSPCSVVTELVIDTPLGFTLCRAARAKCLGSPAEGIFPEAYRPSDFRSFLGLEMASPAKIFRRGHRRRECAGIFAMTGLRDGRFESRFLSGSSWSGARSQPSGSSPIVHRTVFQKASVPVRGTSPSFGKYSVWQPFATVDFVTRPEHAPDIVAEFIPALEVSGANLLFQRLVASPLTGLPLLDFRPSARVETRLGSGVSSTAVVVSASAM